MLLHNDKLFFLNFEKKYKDENRKNRPWPPGGLRSRSQVKGVSGTHRSGQVSGQGFQKNTGQVQVSGQGVPDTWDLINISRTYCQGHTTKKKCRELESTEKTFWKMQEEGETGFEVGTWKTQIKTF